MLLKNNFFFDKKAIKEYNINNREPPAAYRSRGFIRSLIFKFPPDYSGNPYSYRRIHFASTV